MSGFQWYNVIGVLNWMKIGHLFCKFEVWSGYVVFVWCQNIVLLIFEVTSSTICQNFCLFLYRKWVTENVLMCPNVQHRGAVSDTPASSSGST